MTDALNRPRVRHIYQNRHLDGPRWERFITRPGDIVISTSYKAGATLMQTLEQGGPYR
jgi:aryl sulfotransferase